MQINFPGRGTGANQYASDRFVNQPLLLASASKTGSLASAS